MFLDPATKFMEVCSDHLLFVSCVWWWCKKSLPDYFLSLSDTIQIIQGQVGANLCIHICACVCIYLFSFRFLFFYVVFLFTFCSVGHDSTQTRDLKRFFFLLYDRSLSLPVPSVMTPSCSAQEEVTERWMTEIFPHATIVPATTRQYTVLHKDRGELWG